MQISTFCLMALCALGGTARAADPPAIVDDELAEVVIVGREPSFTAPTTRDRIGRVWVPVHINERGPFRLVLDTGATRSAVIPQVVQKLGLSSDASPRVLLRGVTGSAIVPTIDVDSMSVGDLRIAPARLPIVADAFGGAEGILGSDGMQDKRVFIDFRNDFVSIARSRKQRAAPSFSTVPFEADAMNLLVVRARVAGMDVRAIIDTGAQASIGNTALQDALRRQVQRNRVGEDTVTGATGDKQTGVGALIPQIVIGDLSVRNAHITFGDMHIFSFWNLGDEPAIVIGMDLIGLFDTVVIDYARRELQLKLRFRR